MILVNCTFDPENNNKYAINACVYVIVLWCVYTHTFVVCLKLYSAMSSIEFVLHAVASSYIIYV